MRFLSVLLTLFLLTGCSKVPLNNNTKGILVLPMYATSPYKNPFTYRYVVELDQQADDIIITPNVSNAYVIVEDLDPGHYTMHSVYGVGRFNHKTAAKTRYIAPQKLNIQFTIEPGTITVLDHGFFVKSNVTTFTPNANDSWSFNNIGSVEFLDIYAELNKDGYLPNWAISSSSPSAFASK